MIVLAVARWPWSRDLCLRSLFEEQAAAYRMIWHIQPGGLLLYSTMTGRGCFMNALRHQQMRLRHVRVALDHASKGTAAVVEDLLDIIHLQVQPAVVLYIMPHLASC